MKICEFVCAFLLIIPGATFATERLRLATTTSTENSGLIAVLNPAFEATHQAKVDVIAVGTGKAIQLARNGDVDLIIVHAPAAELAFVDGGWGIERKPVMHNDFVLIGPSHDPAGLKRTSNLTDAMQALAAAGTPFVSRGDDSGTHKKELALWQASGIEPGGAWYLSAGQGMGAVLTIADNKLAYTLSDRGTYLAFRDHIELEIVFAGTSELSNPYHVILVNPDRHPHSNVVQARGYAEFVRSEAGQRIINGFKVAGEQLFYGDVKP